MTEQSHPTGMCAPVTTYISLARTHTRAHSYPLSLPSCSAKHACSHPLLKRNLCADVVWSPRRFLQFTASAIQLTPPTGALQALV